MDDNSNSSLDEAGKLLRQEISAVNTALKKAKDKIASVEEYYSQFEALRQKIDDQTTGLTPTLEQANARKQEIDGLKQASDENLAQIVEHLQKIKGNVDEMTTTYTAFQEIKGKIEDPDNGLKALLSISISLRDEIQKTKLGIDEDYRQIKNMLDDTKNIKTQAEKITKAIEEDKKKSSDYKTKISEILALSTDSSLADSFRNRKIELENRVRMWQLYLMISVGLLVLAISGLFYWQFFIGKGAPKFNDLIFLYKFAFTSPFIFAIFFSTQNYNKERDLLEKYSFKYAISLSLQSYVKLLTDNYSETEAKSKLLDFSLKSIDTIYKEPYLEKDKKRRFFISLRQIFEFNHEEDDIKETIIDKAATVVAKDVEKNKT